MITVKQAYTVTRPPQPSTMAMGRHGELVYVLPAPTNGFNVISFGFVDGVNQEGYPAPACRDLEQFEAVNVEMTVTGGSDE